MENEKEYEGLFGCPAGDGNFTSGIGRLSDEGLREFSNALVERELTEHCHKGRIKAVEKALKSRIENSAEIVAADRWAEDVQQAEELYGDGLVYDIDRLENEIRFWQEQAGCALLEMGKRFIRIKMHEEHGRFMKTLENVGMTMRSVQYSMAAARHFSNTKSISHLGATKMIALTVLDDEEVQKLEGGGKVRGMNLDEITAMSVKELRENLRKARTQLEKEKDARKKDREAQEAAITQKEAKINELDQQLRYQQPPTKEQTAVAALARHTLPYTYALADISAGIRKAYTILKEAEKAPGVNVQQLSDWLNQFNNEMVTIAEIQQGWTDEVDEPAPWVDGNAKVIFGEDGAGVSELG